MIDQRERVVPFRGATESGERVLIVDADEQLASDTAAAVLSLGLGAASVSSTAEALTEADRYHPTVLIADIDIGTDLGGLRLAETIRSRWGTSVILVSPRTDADTVRAIAELNPAATLYRPFYWRQLELSLRLTIAGRAGGAGAHGATGSDARRATQSRADLEGALRRIAAELSRVGFGTATPQSPRQHELLRSIRPREREIVLLLLQHHRVPAIARLLSIRPATVRNHLKKVFKQLGVHSQQELLLFFQSGGTRSAT